jgi:pyruvate dehydrogenase E1 component alpha subunit
LEIQQISQRHKNKNIWHSKDIEKGPETFNGVFAESLNLAAVFNLPVIFMLENNHYAVSTRIECSVGDCNLAGRGSAFGIPPICVDGNDVAAVYLETKKAVERARND